MNSQAETTTVHANDSRALGFCLVWIIGTLASWFSFRLVFSGALWNYGVPTWLINVILLVGLWHWIWVAPLLAATQGFRPRLNRGILRGAISFSILQLSLCAALYFVFRHLRFQ